MNSERQEAAMLLEQIDDYLHNLLLGAYTFGAGRNVIDVLGALALTVESERARLGISEATRQ